MLVNKTAKELQIPIVETKDEEYKGLMAQVMRKAKDKKYRMVKSVYVLDDPGVKMKEVYCAINGVEFRFKMGTVRDMPEHVYEVLKQAGKVQGGEIVEAPEKAKKEEAQ